MKWTEISIHTTQEAVEATSNILHESGASGVVIEDPRDLIKVWDTSLGEVYELNPDDYPEEGVIIKAYLSESDKLIQKVEDIKHSITNLASFGIDIGLNKVTMTAVDEEDWANSWKKYYKPVQISEKITIVPTWEEYQAKQDELIIELDPGMAFGTGTHPTTVMCVQALEKYVQSKDNIIDVGTGSGVLSIAAAKLGANHIDAYDLDDVAVTSAKANIELNNVQDSVQVEQKNLLENIKGPVDLIVANLLAEIILKFVGEAYQVVKDDGYFITSGIIEDKKDIVKDNLVSVGFSIVEVIEMEGWVAIIAKK